MSDGLLSLSWNNHKATFCHILSTIRNKEKYTDVTVACEGRFYPVHKLVLSTCSEYFEKIFDNTPCKHPVIVLKDIAWDELEALLSYMYDGVVSVAQNDLARLIKAAEVLRIKGLAVPDEPPPSRNDVGSRKSSQRSSDDRSSPHPKRRRREENASSIGARTSPHSSPRRASPVRSESDPSRSQGDVRWSNEQSSDKPLDDRLHQSASGGPVASPHQVMVDESLVKEEVLDSVDDRDDVIDSGMDYGSLGSDSRLDGSGGADDDSQALPNKFEKGGDATTESQGQPLPDSVVEALAGPSGMQGWLGGCDVPGSFSGMEGFSGEGSQDVHPTQQGPPGSGVQSGAHQMVEMDVDGKVTDNREKNLMGYAVNPLYVQQQRQHGQQQNPDAPDYPNNVPADGRSLASGSSGLIPPRTKLHHCQYCNYSSKFTTNLLNHMRTHTGEKPFSCPHCPYRSNQRTNLRMHMRTHTGEKPFSCPLCPYRSSRKDSVRIHMMMHQ